VGPFVDHGGRVGGLGEGIEVVAEEVVTAEAGVALATLRVQDPEGRPTPRRPIPVAGDERLRPLADDVAPEPDPRPPGKLQAKTGRLGDGGGQAAGRTTIDPPADPPGRLEHDEERLRPPGERRQSAEPVRDPGRAVRRGEATSGQVQDEQVHRATGQQRAADGQTLVQGFRGDDHEPLWPDAAGDRLDRVEAARQIEPGHDRALGLGLRRESQDERRPAAGAVTADRHAGRARQAAGPEDRVECREPGPDDAVIASRGRAREGDRSGRRHGRQGRRRRGRQGQCPIRDPHDPRSCRSPASLEARHGCRHVRGEGRHRTRNIEHLFA